MKRFIMIFFFFSFALIIKVHPAEIDSAPNSPEYKLIGQIQQQVLPEDQNPWGFKYFLKTRQGGYVTLVPLVSRDQETLNGQIQQVMGSDSVVVSGKFGQQELWVGERKYQVSYFVVSHILAVDLGSLGLTPAGEASIPAPTPKSEQFQSESGQRDSPLGFIIPLQDNVANTLIFTSGAALLISLIAN